MDAQTFLDNFGTIAEAPDGINQLRQLILNLAVRGRLVEQDPVEEPARQLLDRISSNREELIRSLGGRRPKALPELEVPPGAVLPGGWSWAQLGDLGLVNPKNVVEDGELAGFVPMELVPTELHDSVRYEERPWREIKKGYTHLADGDLAVAKITPCFQNRKSMVVTGLPGGVGTGTTELHVLRPVPSCVDPGFILLLVKSPVFISGGVRRMTGTAGQQRVPRDYFFGTAVPVPPLSEQNRIVAKVDELMALCGQLETQQQTRTQTATKLRASALDALTTAETADDLQTAWERIHTNWGACTDDLGGVGKVRDLIFGLALRGRLVEQDLTDEPTQSLIEMIEAKSLVTSSKLTNSIGPEDPLWAVPNSWRWVRLKQVVDFAPGKTPSTKNAAYWATEGGVAWAGIADMPAGGVLTQTAKRVSELALDDVFKKPPAPIGTLLMSFKLTIGKVCRLGVPSYFNEAIISIETPYEETDKYLFQTLPRLATAGVTKAAVKGATLNKESLTNLLIPLPPLAEQRRIVARVDELMGLCDELETRLRESDRLGEALAASVVDTFAA